VRTSRKQVSEKLSKERKKTNSAVSDTKTPNRQPVAMGGKGTMTGEKGGCERATLENTTSGGGINGWVVQPFTRQGRHIADRSRSLENATKKRLRVWPAPETSCPTQSQIQKKTELRREGKWQTPAKENSGE